ncbi:MAG: pilus assembly protein TadG-related protein [Pseudomonadota bacterium]
MRYLHFHMTAWCRDKVRQCKRIKKDIAGTAGVLWGITLPVVIGGIGLGTDIGSWYLSEHNQQNATDAAAIAAGYEITGGNPQQTTLQAAANKELVRNGYSSDNSVTMTVHYPPQTGPYAGNSQAVEVTTSRPQPRFFSKLFLNSEPLAISRAVASRQPFGSACVLSLASSGANALLIQGSSTIDLTNCSAASNSIDNVAISITGSSSLTTYSLYTAGGYEQGGSANLITSNGAITNGAALADPYSGLSLPSYSGCARNNYNEKATATINPGVYCNGMSFGSKAVVTMSPGTYIVDRGSFDVNAGARVTGNGVTIILTSSTGSNYANVNVSGGATVSLSAPTSSAYAGMLFYQDRNAPIATNSNKLNGGSSTNYVGALYFPQQELEFTGNNSSNSGACTKIIARTVSFSGNSYLSNNCPASVATVATQGTVQLVE